MAPLWAQLLMVTLAATSTAATTTITEPPDLTTPDKSSARVFEVPTGVFGKIARTLQAGPVSKSGDRLERRAGFASSAEDENSSDDSYELHVYYDEQDPKDYKVFSRSPYFSFDTKTKDKPEPRLSQSGIFRTYRVRPHPHGGFPKPPYPRPRPYGYPRPPNYHRAPPPPPPTQSHVKVEIHHDSGFDFGPPEFFSDFEDDKYFSSIHDADFFHSVTAFEPIPPTSYQNHENLAHRPPPNPHRPPPAPHHPPPTSHHFSPSISPHLNSIVKDNIYRNDVPVKDHHNPRDKVRPDLDPAGIKGLHPDLIHFIEGFSHSYDGN